MHDDLLFLVKRLLSLIVKDKFWTPITTLEKAEKLDLNDQSISKCKSVNVGVGAAAVLDQLRRTDQLDESAILQFNNTFL